MPGVFSTRIKKSWQYLLSIVIIALTTGICFAVSSYIGYRAIALILLLAVSLIAISFDIWPVLLSALLSAFIWDFFFIPPNYTLHVSSTDDTIFLIMYFIIAILSAVMTFKIRQIEKATQRREEKAKTIKLYDTLLNSLSHELRTPIATIVGATDNLQAGNNNLSEQNKTQLINEISKASFRLNQQVENLLNMSRLESGFLKPRKDWCDINEIIYGVVDRVEENQSTRRISININPNFPLFKLDKIMLEQVIYNLLNNACLHTPVGTNINISAINHADMLEIVVEDNGPGFPAAEIENVFDKFYRLDPANKNGTGLGLSIVKGFVEAMGGAVTLQNVLSGGARFIVNVPGEVSNFKV